jgi:hypothetical protein
MSETNDEEIQRMLEEMQDDVEKDFLLNKDGEFLEDARMYQLLFKELKNLPAAELSPGFATRLTRHIAASEQRAGAAREDLFIILSFTIAGILLAIGTVIWIGGFDTLHMPRPVVYCTVFAALCFLILQRLENSMMKRKVATL